MNLVRFPAARVVEINALILKNGQGKKGAPDKAILEGALARVDNAIVYEGLSDIFEIAAKYAKVIAEAHALSDANKRTGLMVALEYLALNDHEIEKNYDPFADAMVDLVLGSLTEHEFADLLYAAYSSRDSSLFSE